MKNAMQLKALVKNMAAAKHTNAQFVLQYYMMERFLERVSASRYYNNFIVKGGFLIASIIGIDFRSTMDMDATIKYLPVSKDMIERMVKEIIAIEIPDSISFSFLGIEDIRKDDEYSGYRVSLQAQYLPMSVPLKLDITTGDKITPCEIVYNYRLLFEDRSIDVLAYNLVTVLAEKLETIINRQTGNTRMKDFYDMYVITKLRGESIDYILLREALAATSAKRGSDIFHLDYCGVIELLAADEHMRALWNKYRNDYSYYDICDLDFGEVCDSILHLLKRL